MVWGFRITWMRERRCIANIWVCRSMDRLPDGGITAGGRTLETLDEEIESVNDTFEIMSGPTTLKNIEHGVKDVKERRIMTFEEFLNKHS